MSEIFLPMFPCNSYMLLQPIFVSSTHLEFIFVYNTSWWLSFIFFACSCPNLLIPSVEEAIFTLFYAPVPFVKYLLAIETWVYFWALYSVPLIYVSVLMPVPDCFDYSGLVIHFDIRYCDPSCFVLLSQNCCSTLGAFMIPHEFLNILYLWNISRIL